MKRAFQKAGRRRAAATGAALVVAAGLLSGCGLKLHFNEASGACLVAGQENSLGSPQRKELSSLLQKARETQIARYILSGTAQQQTLICLDDALAKPDSNGVTTVGVFNDGRNRILLNPAYPAYRKAMTLVHEGRHNQQAVHGINWSTAWGNIPDEERVILNWATEADARVSSIVFAYEMAQNGEPEYITNLKTDSWYRHMIDAFEISLIQKPQDMRQAMQAAFRAFRSNVWLAKHYDNRAVDWIEKWDWHFDPEQQPDTILYDETLMNLGRMGPYGNYMDKELMIFIRNSFTPEDYRQLLQERKNPEARLELERHTPPGLWH